MIIHIIGGILILIGTLTLGIIAIEEMEGNIENFPHAIVGFITVIVSGLVLAGGFIAKITMVSFKWRSKMLLINRFGHKVFAWLILILAQVSIVLGIIKYTSIYGISSIAAYVHIVAFILILIICEVIFQIISRR
jgi:hypothetical protein